MEEHKPSSDKIAPSLIVRPAAKLMGVGLVGDRKRSIASQQPQWSLRC